MIKLMSCYDRGVFVKIEFESLCEAQQKLNDANV